MKLETWLAFLIAAWAISLSPGAGAVSAMTAGLRHGLRFGYWNTIGLQLALILQVAIVAAGLGALLTASEWAFESIRWFGAGYLCWLGLQQWRAPASRMEALTALPKETRRRLILRGFLVNAGNPKAIVFMLAVLPQFIDPARPLPAQYLAIVATMVAVDMLVMAGYTGLAAKVLRYLREERHVRLLNRSFGGMFIAAGIALAMFRRSPAGA